MHVKQINHLSFIYYAKKGIAQAYGLINVNNNDGNIINTDKAIFYMLGHSHLLSFLI